MLSRFNPIQIVALALMAVASALYIATFLSMAYRSFKSVYFKKRNRVISFNSIYNTLSQNEKSINQSTQKLNDYQS